MGFPAVLVQACPLGFHGPVWGTVPEGNTTGEDELLCNGCRLPAEHSPGIPISPAKCTYDFIKIKNVCSAKTLLRR